MNQSGSVYGAISGMTPAAPMSILNPNAANRGSAQPAEKKRRLGAPTHVPMPTTNVRASSIDRNTPKAGTPGSRAGSVQPARPANKKLAVTTTTARKAPPHTQTLKKSSTLKSIGSQKKSRRSTAASPTPTEAEDDDDDDDEEEEEEGGEEEESDDTKYCVCQSVRYVFFDILSSHYGFTSFSSHLDTDNMTATVTWLLATTRNVHINGSTGVVLA